MHVVGIAVPECVRVFLNKILHKGRAEEEGERMRCGAKQATKRILAVSLVLGYRGCDCALTCTGTNIL
jgi:hypothetical protein